MAANNKFFTLTPLHLLKPAKHGDRITFEDYTQNMQDIEDYINGIAKEMTAITSVISFKGQLSTDAFLPAASNATDGDAYFILDNADGSARNEMVVWDDSLQQWVPFPWVQFYPVANSNTSGLMSSADYTKLKNMNGVQISQDITDLQDSITDLESDMFVADKALRNLDAFSVKTSNDKDIAGKGTIPVDSQQMSLQNLVDANKIPTRFEVARSVHELVLKTEANKFLIDNLTNINATYLDGRVPVIGAANVIQTGSADKITFDLTQADPTANSSIDWTGDDIFHIVLSYTAPQSTPILIEFDIQLNASAPQYIGTPSDGYTAFLDHGVLTIEQEQGFSKIILADLSIDNVSFVAKVLAAQLPSQQDLQAAVGVSNAADAMSKIANQKSLDNEKLIDANKLAIANNAADIAANKQDTQNNAQGITSINTGVLAQITKGGNGETVFSGPILVNGTTPVVLDGDALPAKGLDKDKTYLVKTDSNGDASYIEYVPVVIPPAPATISIDWEDEDGTTGTAKWEV